MADNNEKKPLGLKGGTLGLSKSLSDKLSMVPNARMKSSSSTSSSGRGKVVVVTKATRGGKSSLTADNAAGYISEVERDKRLRLLKEAEKTRKFEHERKERDQQDAQNMKQQQQSVDQVESSDQQLENVEIKEEIPYVETQQTLERIKLRDVNQSGKVKNLNELYRPVKTAKPVEPIIEPEKAAETTKMVLPALAPKHGAKKRGNVEEEKEIAAAARRITEDKKASRKFTVAQVMMMDSDEPGAVKRRSVASIRRAREKAKRKMMGDSRQTEKIIREVNIPDVLTVGELANRMAEKAADVIKSLMKLGLMVTVNQSIDADTAELVIGEFGHKFKRVTDAEIESALLQKVEDSDESMRFRPPVVTIMGHVDHGKTSLLDALRDTDVVGGEAGGITQHIGAYQIRLHPDKVITFLDTPGHEAFTAMRMRGAKVTDIVVLVVAADDGIMQQTIEAISHAKAASVPIIVAINKIDKPGADSSRVKNELLQHGIVPEDMGGDTMVIEVSAKQKLNLDKLEEGILIQAEMLDLKANPNRTAEGAVIEAKVDKGRGIVATVLVQKGTLRIGDIIVAGATWGKIRALVNDKGLSVTEALPSTPIEIVGLSEAPVAGDEFTIVTNEKAARDIITLRQEKEKHRKMVASKSITLDQLFKRAHTEHGLKELPIIIKADVQGSVEAIANSLTKLGTEEISVRVLHSAVGGITESDVTLASASKAIIIGFNVRASQQARDLSKVYGIDIRYYSIIYNLVDDVRAAMSGMLSPFVKENIIGYAEIRQVIDLTKYGKIAGCYVTEGIVKRSANIRIIRDSVVIYDGKLKALKRFKDDVREVNSGFECGISLENYEDIKVNDRLEVYEVTEHARTI